MDGKLTEVNGRVRDLEGRVLVLESVVSDLREVPETLSTLRISIEGRFQSLLTQTKITWAMLVLVMIGLLGIAWSILQGGISLLQGVP